MFRIFLGYFFLFFIYSIIGWIVETMYTAIELGRFTDRGFLIGPYCPVYGFGSLGVILYLTQYRDNIVTVFILGIVICSVLEYFTSYIMEKCFKARWWDYSNRKFNLNGRICGLNCLLFGIGSIFIIYLFQPLLDLILIKANSTFLLVINIICLIIFVVDTIFSLNIASRFKYTIKNLDIKKDSTEEYAKLVKDAIKRNRKFFQERLFMAFPDIDLGKIIEFKNDIKDDIKEFLHK